MEKNEVLVEQEGHVTLITLNRPERLNAQTSDSVHLLMEELQRANREEEVRAIILTGAGRGFCTGADLRQLSEANAPLVPPSARFGLSPDQLFFYFPVFMQTIEKPLIAAVNGPAAGWGFDLTLTCDIRLASDQASFGAVFVRRGLMPDGGSTYHLPRLVGLSRAAELMFTGEMVSAQEAERLGLVSRVFPHEQLLSEARALAQRIAAAAPLAVRAAKRALRLASSSSLEQAMEEVALVQSRLGQTEDLQEGMRSFFERREPVFRGR